MSDLRDKYIQFVRAHLIQESWADELFTKYLELIPEPFWTAPASSSGKYHPAHSLGEGGLVRHSAEVVYLAVDLSQLYKVDQRPVIDAVVLAAALHDTFKGGDSAEWEKGKTHKQHATIAATKMLDLLDKDAPLNIRKLHIQAAWAMADHMSLWGPTPTSLRSANPISSTIVMADYMASRKYFQPDAALHELMLHLDYDFGPSKDEVVDALDLAIGEANSWSHDQLDGTSELEPVLERLSSAREVLNRLKGGTDATGSPSDLEQGHGTGGEGHSSSPSA